MIKSIIITGGGSGIGQYLAHRMSDKGLDVLIVGRRQQALEETASYNPDKIKYVPADVNNDNDLDLITSAAEKLSPSVGLFHGAGIYHINRLTEISMEDWRTSFDINVTARLALTQKLLPLLNQGRVLFIGSDAGRTVRIGAGAYSVAQSASETLVNVLKLELAEHQVSVGHFKPGLVKTDMVERFLQESPENFPAVDFYRDWIAKGQIADPDRIACFARWLLLETDDGKFTENQWDIRDEEHHEHWLEGTLYENFATH